MCVFEFSASMYQEEMKNEYEICLKTFLSYGYLLVYCLHFDKDNNLSASLK